MWTLACILILIKIRKKHKWLSIVLIIVIISLLTIIIRNVCIFLKMRDLNKNKEWISMSEFSSSVNIEKEWQISSYPEIIVLSEIDWEIITLNINQGDIVNKWDILAQIWNQNKKNEIVNFENKIEEKYDKLGKKTEEYNNFEKEHWNEISELEKKLYEYNTLLQIYTDLDDKNNKENTQKEIQNINSKLTSLKKERDKLKSEILNIQNEINLSTQESIDLYNEAGKQTPRAQIQWIVSNLYVQEWDKIQNWDKICTIINNSSTPEINVSLNFNEYLLTKDLTWVTIITENENRWDSYYYGEIYTRSPILNEKWEYTITVKIMEDDIPDLILNDENTKITVIFTLDSTSVWLPTNCFTHLSKNSWTITLREGDVKIRKKVWIKSERNEWINIEEIISYSLENEAKKDEIETEILCRIE